MAAPPTSNKAAKTSKDASPRSVTTPAFYVKASDAKTAGLCIQYKDLNGANPPSVMVGGVEFLDLSASSEKLLLVTPDKTIVKVEIKQAKEEKGGWQFACSALEGHVKELKKDVNDVKGDVKVLEDKVQALETKNTTLENKVQALETKNTTLENEIAAIKEALAKIDANN